MNLENRSMRLIPLLVASIVFCMASSASILSQGTASGSIQGQVLDASGAVIPGATVTARETSTGLSRTVPTDSDGFYKITLLPVGRYEVTGEMQGFSTTKRGPLDLAVGQTLVANLSLAIAATQQVVEVTEETPAVETARTQVSTNISDRSVAELPVNGRNFIDFVLLTPGVTRDVRTGDISFGGQRGTLNSLQIDGADNNNTFFGQALGRTGSGRAPYQFSQDAVREFQVNSNGYSAEFGRAGGAVVNVVTKSGTNDFHGTVFEFYRDKSLNANTFFNNANNRVKSPFHINQFGGNIGGPIVRDRAFFFFDYDGQRQKVNNDVILGGARPFPSDAASQAGLGKLQALAGNYIRGFDQNVYLFKTDVQLNDANRLTARYNDQRFTGSNLENSGQTSALEHTGNSLVTTNTLTLSLSSIVTPRKLNEFRFQYGRDKEPGEANSTRPEAEVRQGGTVVLIIGRNNFSPRETTVKRTQFVDNFSYVTGRHDLKFGVDVNHDRIKNFFPGQFGGQYFFASLAQFNAGVPGSYVQAFAGANTSGPLTFPNSTDYAFFAQDSWRVHRDLQLSLGLRYDLQVLATPPTANPDAQLAAAGISTNQIHRDKNNWGPRFGYAWKPTSSDRFVVRGGYGFFFARTPAIMLAQAHSQNGVNVLNLTFTGSALPTYPSTFTTIPTGGTPARPSLYVFQKDYVNPYVQQGSLGAEFGIGNDISVTATYLFVKGTHLQRTRDLNFFPPVPTTITTSTGSTLTYLRLPGTGGAQTRPLSNFARISQFESNADSHYHGLAFQANKRYSRNFQALLSYTFSKAIDDVPDATAVVSGTDDSKLLQNNLNIRDDRALSVNDQRHRLVISGIWYLAYANDLSSPVARGILGGWSISAIFQAASGRPYSSLVGSDLNNDANRNTDRVPGEGRNTNTGFNFISLDPRITREIRFHENLRLQFIFESFNILNRANFSTINTTRMALVGTQLVPQANFGTASNTFDPRIIQLAAKILF